MKHSSDEREGLDINMHYNGSFKNRKRFFPKKSLITQKGILRRMEFQRTPHPQENHYPQDS